MRRVAALVLLATGAFASPALSQARPISQTGDPRLQTVLYDPLQVVELSVAGGYQLMVSFAEGERIETIAVGDSTAWQVTSDERGANLFIKSVQPGGDTNLTVVSDAHVYSFKLTRNVLAGAAIPYIVRFTYPEPPANVVAVPASQTRYRYRLGGERSIRPSDVTVDGGNIVIAWAKNQILPAIFRIDDDGEETLVNGEMRDDRFIVGGTPPKLVFRLDRMIATATRLQVRERRR